MLRKPRRVPPRWGFPFGCEAGTVQWEVERTEGGDPREFEADANYFRDRATRAEE
jgi:hypothetical protein